MPSSSDLIRQKNSIHLLRFFAALQVMLQHMTEFYVLPPGLARIEEILDLFPGVPIFFMLSGYLIWDSVEHSRTYGEYLKKRFWRIYPELWICVLLELCSLIFLYSHPVPPIELLLFAFGQATVFQFWKPASLALYGCGTPNGSLWTIPVFVLFYLLAWWLHRFLHRKGKSRWLLFFLIAGVASVLIRASEGYLPDVIYKLLDYSLLPYLWLFLVGMLTAEYVRTILPVLRKYWYLFLLAALLLPTPGLDVQLGYYFFFNSLLHFCGWLGFAYRFPKLHWKTDISYGMYIYHMPVINILLTLWGNQAAWLVPVTAAVSCCLAWLSAVGVGFLRKAFQK